MKKVYIQPSIEAYNVQNETVLAGSTQSFGVESGSNEYTSDDFGAKGASGDFDFEEED